MENQIKMIFSLRKKNTLAISEKAYNIDQADVKDLEHQKIF